MSETTGHPLDLPAIAAYGASTGMSGNDALEGWSLLPEEERADFRAMADAVIMVADAARPLAIPAEILVLLALARKDIAEGWRETTDERTRALLDRALTTLSQAGVHSPDPGPVCGGEA